MELAEAVTGLASGTEEMPFFEHLMGEFPVCADRGIEDVKHKPNPAISCSFV